MSDEQVEFLGTMEAAETVARAASWAHTMMYWEVPETDRDFRRIVSECGDNSDTKLKMLLESLHDMKNEDQPNPIRLKRIQEQVFDLGQETIRNADHVGYKLEPYQRRNLNFYRMLTVEKNVLRRNFAANRELFAKEDAEEKNSAEKAAFAKKAAAANASDNEEPLTAEEQKKLDHLMHEVQNAFADANLDDEEYKARLEELLPTEWENVWALTAAKRRHYLLQKQMEAAK